ncbi:MAG: NAD-dependent epimerase/dehydratase family protein [bacterium]|nr:NAD-dependent epimerase/dehydratase family protein [bacterium]
MCKSGHKVRALVRTTEQAEKVTRLGCEAVLGDLLNPTSLENACKGVDGVYHIAALFRQAGLPASQFAAVNVDGTKNILDAAIKCGVKRFIHCSTVGVHGHIASPPANEETPYNPGDAYQESKCTAEKMVQNYLDEGKISGLIIRPAMIYGPHDQRTLKLFKMLSMNRFFYVGQGNALVHFVDVRDLARAFMTAMDRSDINAESFIIAGESSLRLNMLVSIICNMMGVAEPFLHLPAKPIQLLGSLCEIICTPFKINPPIYRRRVDFFTKDRNFNCAKAAKMLSFRPRMSLTQELMDIIQSYINDNSIRSDSSKFPVVIDRDLNGKIKFWHDDTNNVYGWSKEQAVGHVSHSLFGTDFPDKLEVINTSLNLSQRWHGKLKHNTRYGKRIEVNSNWFLINSTFSSAPYVLELNRVAASSKFVNGISNKVAGAFNGAYTADVLCALESISPMGFARNIS